MTKLSEILTGYLLQYWRKARTMKKTFAELFKKYRLRAEFEKLSDFGDALAEKGILHEDSLFSHWQKGNRIPTDRRVLLKLIVLFVERKAILSLDEVNEFLESTRQGYLTKNEIEILPDLIKNKAVFQVPKEVSDFTGREENIEILQQKALEEK